jgi:hypothetical protein
MLGTLLNSAKKYNDCVMRATLRKEMEMLLGYVGTLLNSAIEYNDSES